MMQNTSKLKAETNAAVALIENGLVDWVSHSTLDTVETQIASCFVDERKAAQDAKWNAFFFGIGVGAIVTLLLAYLTM